MPTNRKLQTILVSPMQNQIGVTFVFEGLPSDHFLLPVPVARALVERITQACDMSTSPQPTGDRIGVSEHVAMQFVGSPKGH